MNPMLLTDFYKIGHYQQYPAGTTMVYSNLTARKSRHKNIDRVVFFGLQYFTEKYLVQMFRDEFFSQPIGKVIAEYSRIIKNTIGGLPNYNHIEALHGLGYLPLEIKALPEGSLVPIGVPMLTVRNTKDEFYWLTNFIESLMSAVVWQPITSATFAYKYRKLFTELDESAGGSQRDMIDFCGHDFSFRGMGGLESAVLSGMGHLLSFKGTDTIPAILAMEEFYGADVEKELVGCSVPATEHSVMSSGTAIHGELETFRSLIEDIYPKGIVSVVSDTFDLWEVLTKYMPALKDVILARDGKVVIRPDSGDPVDIICGDSKSTDKNASKGVVELLWDVFGGAEIGGYKHINPKVGVIYGDSITMDRAQQIGQRLMAKGFAPLIVYGIGSFTYQFQTRDTFGMAVKCTAIENNGKLVEVFKDPVTDDGTKKSLKGLLRVIGSNGFYAVRDSVSREAEQGGELQTVFKDGVITKKQTLREIRERLLSLDTVSISKPEVL